jgi:hypothetical protein
MVRSTSLAASVIVLALVAGSHLAASGATTLVRATPGHVTTDRLPAGAVRPNGGTILGSVWNEKNEGVPNALVRLRNLGTGRLEATVRADAKGQFSFEGLEGGSYVLEYVNDQGKVLALGHNFTVLPGETIATFIRVGARLPWFANFFGNAAASAVSSAASLGVTAVAPPGQPTTPER